MARNTRKDDDESNRRKKKKRGPAPLYTQDEIRMLQCRRDVEAKKGNLHGADICRRQLAEAGVYD